MNFRFRFLASFLLALFAVLPVYSQSQTFNIQEFGRPRWLLTKQFAAGANVFSTTDPNTGSLTPTSATGRDGGFGHVTVMLTNGYTPPVTLTAYYWNPEGSFWARVAPIAAQYAVAVDTTYASWTFEVPAQAIYIITSSGAVTGNVYVDSPYAPQNPNHVN